MPSLLSMPFNPFHRGHISPPIYNPPPGPPPQSVIVSSSGPPTGFPSFYAPHSTDPPPPGWTATPEKVHHSGLLNDATEAEYHAGEEFCRDAQNAVDMPRMLPSYQIDEIRQKHGKVWCMESPQMPRWSGLNGFPTLKRPRWFGRINPTGGVATSTSCQDVCLLSNLPLIGHYYITGGGSKGGVYFEVEVIKMASTISIGTACKPYPVWWRHPGWNRLSYALHLDDYRIFDRPYGGSDYQPFSSDRPKIDGSTIGCGFDLNERSIFFTYEGRRLPDAYRGIYPGVYQTDTIQDPDSNSAVPSEQHYDVYAAIGVSGESDFRVNFGGERFLWEEGNLPHWKVENHFLEDDLPPYNPFQ